MSVQKLFDANSQDAYQHPNGTYYRKNSRTGNFEYLSTITGTWQKLNSSHRPLRIELHKVFNTEKIE